MPAVFSTSRPIRPLRWLGVVGALCLACYVIGVSNASTETPAITPPACTATITPAG